jgi:hypothetical protein
MAVDIVAKKNQVVIVPLYGVPLPNISFPTSTLAYRKEVVSLLKLVDSAQFWLNKNGSSINFRTTFKDANTLLQKLKHPTALARAFKQVTGVSEKFLLTKFYYPYPEIIEHFCKKSFLTPNLSSMSEDRRMDFWSMFLAGELCQDSYLPSRMYRELLESCSSGPLSKLRLDLSLSGLSSEAGVAKTIPVDLTSFFSNLDLGPGALVFTLGINSLKVSYISVGQSCSGSKLPFGHLLKGVPLYWNLVDSHGTSDELRDLTLLYHGAHNFNKIFFKNTLFRDSGDKLRHIPKVLRHLKNNLEFRLFASYAHFIEEDHSKLFLPKHLSNKTKKYITGLNNADASNKVTYHMLSPMQARGWLSGFFKSHVDDSAFEAIQDTIFYDDRADFIFGFDGLIFDAVSKIQLVNKRLYRSHLSRNIRAGAVVQIADTATEAVKLAYPKGQFYTVKHCNKKNQTLRLVENDHFGVVLNWAEVETV